MPEERCHCGKILKPVAVKDSDGWILMWPEWCDTCNGPTGHYDDEYIAWPFIESHAHPRDFRELGFDVEVA